MFDEKLGKKAFDQGGQRVTDKKFDRKDWKKTWEPFDRRSFWSRSEPDVLFFSANSFSCFSFYHLSKLFRKTTFLWDENRLPVKRNHGEVSLAFHRTILTFQSSRWHEDTIYVIAVFSIGWKELRSFGSFVWTLKSVTETHRWHRNKEKIGVHFQSKNIRIELN